MKTTDAHVQQWGNRNISVKALSFDDIQKKVGTSAYTGGLIDERGGNLHPLKYARGLAKACISLGVSIFCDTPATSVKRIGNRWVIKTLNGTIKSETVIICTNGYTGSMLPGLSQSIIPVLTGVISWTP